MAAPEAKIYKFLIDALVAKARKPSLQRYQGFSYDNYILKYAKRMLPYEFTKKLVQRSGQWDSDSVLAFTLDIQQNSNKEILTSLTRNETAPDESDKFHQEFEKDTKTEQEAAKTEEPAKKQEQKPEENPEEKPTAVSQTPKEEPEKAAEEAAKPAVVNEAQHVADQAWAAGEKTPVMLQKAPVAVKHEEANPKPKFAMVGAQKVAVGLTNEEKARLQRVKETHPDILARSKVVVPQAFTKAFELPRPPEPPIMVQTKGHLPKVTVPEPIKDTGSFLQRTVRRLLYRIPTIVTVGGVVGGLGGLVTAGPAGAVLGTVGGVAVSNYIARRQEASISSQPEEYTEETNPPEAPSGPAVQSSQQTGQGSTGATFNTPNTRQLNSIRNRLFQNSAKKAASSVEKKVAGEVAKTAAKALVTQPEFWAVLLIIVIALTPLIMKLFETNSLCPPYQAKCGGGGGPIAGGTPILQDQIKLTKTAPPSVPNGSDIPYTITVTNTTTSAVNNIELDDKLPDNTSFVSASDGGTLNSGVVNWTISSLAAGQTKTITLTLHPTQNDISITNTVIVGGGNVGGGTTGVGTPPSGNPSTGPDFAIQLVDLIGKFCGGSINSGNIDCISQFLPPISQAAAQAIRDNMAYNGIFQCVGFVEAVVTQITGQGLPTYNAIQYASNPIPGYTFITPDQGITIQPGDMPVFDEGSVGHIAYVISVSDQQHFTIAEANYCHPDCGTARDDRSLSTSYPYLLGWLRKQ